MSGYHNLYAHVIRSRGGKRRDGAGRSIPHAGRSCGRHGPVCRVSGSAGQRHLLHGAGGRRQRFRPHDGRVPDRGRRGRNAGVLRYRGAQGADCCRADIHTLQDGTRDSRAPRRRRLRRRGLLQGAAVGRADGGKLGRLLRSIPRQGQPGRFRDGRAVPCV